MAPRMTVFNVASMEFGFWLIFSKNGGMRMARTEPSLHRDERSMYCSVTLPKALWQTPQLRATITIADPGPEAHQFNLSAAGDALKEALGCDVDFRIIPVDTQDKTS